MTLKIALSQLKALPFDFEQAVASFVKAKQDHRQTEGEMAPCAPHPYVEAAVKRVPGSIEPPRADEFVADYEIVDDSPPPKSLDQRKTELAGKVGLMANEAMAQIIPPLKHRLWEMEHARIQQDLAMVKPLENETRELWLARALDAIKQASPADHASFTAHEIRKAKLAAIIRHMAICESDIHDLTEATIDAWSVPPFPK
jgi:hypothetical protein